MRGRLTLCGLLLAAAAAPAQSPPQGPAFQGGAFLGSHGTPPFTPTQVFTAPQAAILTKPAPPPDPATDPLLGDPLPPPPPPLWSGSIDAGLNGATGNTQLFNLRSSGHVKRETATNILTGDLLYTYTNDTGKVTVHQVLSNARDEFLFADTPWSAFTSTLLEYDQLRDYRFRVAVYAGTGYTVVNTKELTFKLRAGAGAVRELGSTATITQPVTDPVTGLPVTDPVTGRPQTVQVQDRTRDRWVPEFVFGDDFRWAWNDRSSFLSVVDYYPRVDDFTQFRVRARAAYEYVLDPKTNMIVRFGVQDRYDSSPGRNSKRNDLTYFSTFGVKF